MYDDFDPNFDGTNREAEMRMANEELRDLWRTTYLIALDRLLPESPADAKVANDQAMLVAKSAIENYTVLFLQPVDDDDGDE